MFALLAQCRRAQATGEAEERRVGWLGRGASPAAARVECAERHAQRDTTRARGQRDHGNCDGALRRFVACSNAYASAMSFGSLHAVPVKLTLYGCGFGSKPAGNAVGPSPAGTGTNVHGTVTVG